MSCPYIRRGLWISRRLLHWKPGPRPITEGTDREHDRHLHKHSHNSCQGSTRLRPKQGDCSSDRQLEEIARPDQCSRGLLSNAAEGSKAYSLVALSELEASCRLEVTLIPSLSLAGGEAGRFVNFQLIWNTPLFRSIRTFSNKRLKTFSSWIWLSSE